MLKTCQNNKEECKKLAENINCSRCEVVRSSDRPVHVPPYKKKEKRK